MAITEKTSLLALAALVSQALEAAGITATLSGGGAVSAYTDNRYQSKDLDLVSSERLAQLGDALKPLGFALASSRRHFPHPQTDIYLEFPPAPLEFGNRMVQHSELPKLVTPWGPLRIITPTLCVMDRLAAYWHWNDRQSWEQAVLVASCQTINYDDLMAFAREEASPVEDVEKLRVLAAGSKP